MDRTRKFPLHKRVLERMRQDAKAKADVQFRLSYRFPCCCFLFTAPVSKVKARCEVRKAAKTSPCQAGAKAATFGWQMLQEPRLPLSGGRCYKSQGCHLRVADATRAKAVTFGWQMRAGSDEMKMQPRFPDQDRTGEAKRRVGWPIRTITPK